LTAVDAVILVVAAAQIPHEFPLMPLALGCGLFGDITPTITVIAAGAEVTIAMTVLWSVLLIMQIVGIDPEIPSTVSFAARAQNLEIILRLSDNKVYESIRVIWCKKV
jgi:hypothetical protein